MEKKIIAVVSVVILLASVLAACGKKPTVTLKEGQEYELVTDKEGNTIVNDNGELLVYAVDGNGKYVKDENGKRQQNAVTFPDVVVKKNVLETPDFVMTFPEEWKISKTGRATKTEYEKMSFKIEKLELKDDDTFESYTANVKEQTEYMASEIKKKCPDTTLTAENATLTIKQLDCRIIELKSVKEDGTVVLYNCEIYYMFKGDLYKIHYSCKEGGYDETIDVASLVNNGLIMKDKKADKQ